MTMIETLGFAEGWGGGGGFFASQSNIFLLAMDDVEAQCLRPVHDHGALTRSANQHEAP